MISLKEKWKEKFCYKSIRGRASWFSNQGKYHRFLTKEALALSLPMAAANEAQEAGSWFPRAWWLHTNLKTLVYLWSKTEAFSEVNKGATCKLQLVHTDISRTQRTPSLAGNRCYVAFIDDFTSGNQIQILTSDNSKESTSENLNQVYEEAGIEHQLTTP